MIVPGFIESRLRLGDRVFAPLALPRHDGLFKATFGITPPLLSPNATMAAALPMILSMEAISIGLPYRNAR
jgi:hypothetical protein